MGFLLVARLARQGGAALSPAAQHLESEHQDAVGDQEAGGLIRAREQRFDPALQEHAEDRRGNRACEKQHGQTLGVGLHLAADRGGEKSADDRHPLLAVQDQERGCGAQVKKDEKRNE